jgi:cytochrome bd-type quinol oxidase subunit 2
MSRQKFWIIGILTFLISGLLAFINLREFYKTRILKQTENYNFGGEGPVPYYYKTAEFYSTVNLIWGLLFILTLVFTTWTILKRKNKSLFFAFGLTLFLVLIMFIHGQIGQN